MRCKRFLYRTVSWVCLPCVSSPCKLIVRACGRWGSDWLCGECSSSRLRTMPGLELSFISHMPRSCLASATLCMGSCLFGSPTSRSRQSMSVHVYWRLHGSASQGNKPRNRRIYGSNSSNMLVRVATAEVGKYICQTYE